MSLLKELTLLFRVRLGVRSTHNELEKNRYEACVLSCLKAYSICFAKPVDPKPVSDLAVLCIAFDCVSFRFANRMHKTAETGFNKSNRP